MSKLLGAVLAAVLLVGGGLAAPSSAAPGSATPDRPGAAERAPAYRPPAIDWKRCAWIDSPRYRCGMLTVPLDYDRPDGRTVKLAVSRLRHTTERYQGVVLVNPGGPGASGLQMSTLGGYLPGRAGASYDWIGFDPRGVGSSRPSLSCDTEIFAPGRPAYVPTTTAIADHWQQVASEYADACAAVDLGLLRHTDTRTWVQDVESLRKALHQRRINYYGFSYGTYLGQVYATEHPDRVRRFVLDGVVNPQDVWYDANLAQDEQFDRNIDTFFDWVAAHRSAYHLGSDGDRVRDVYYDVLQQLTDHPRKQFGAADWNDVFVGAGYHVYGWDETARVLAAAADGRLRPAIRAYGDPTGPGADNLYANYLAVQCTDAPWPSDWDVWQQDNDAMHAQHPFLTWENAWFNAPCRTWPAPSGTPVEVDGAKAPPILLVSESEDAATPFAGALEARRLFPRSVLIEGVGGTTHSSSLSGVSCVDDRIARYFRSGALDRRTAGQGHADVRCPALEPWVTSGRARPAATGGLPWSLRQQLVSTLH